MAKAGRKPIDLRYLDQLDRECFKGFHRLCKGVPLPVAIDEARRMLRLEQSEQRAHEKDLRALKRVSLQTFCANFSRGGRASDLKAAADIKTGLEERYAEGIQESMERQQDLASVIQELSDSKNARRRLTGYGVWRSLWQASNGAEVKELCHQWMKLPRRYRDDLVCAQVIKHSEAFFNMMNNERFPRSSSGDDARITYLARGTAGLFMGISPLTAIERLRKISHKRGHPLFVGAEVNSLLPEAKDAQPAKLMCMCWRCALDRRRTRGVLPF